MDLKSRLEDYLLYRQHPSIVTLLSEVPRTTSILWLHHTKNKVQIKNKTKIILIYRDVFIAWSNIYEQAFEKVGNGFKP